MRSRSARKKLGGARWMRRTSTPCPPVLGGMRPHDEPGVSFGRGSENDTRYSILEHIFGRSPYSILDTRRLICKIKLILDTRYSSIEYYFAPYPFYYDNYHTYVSTHKTPETFEN